jgi:hypothetical protein
LKEVVVEHGRRGSPIVPSIEWGVEGFSGGRIWASASEV